MSITVANTTRFPSWAAASAYLTSVRARPAVAKETGEQVYKTPAGVVFRARRTAGDAIDLDQLSNCTC